MPSNSVSHPCKTGAGRLHRALAGEQEVRRVVEHPRDGDLHQRAPVHGRMQVRPKAVHHVRGVVEALGGDERRACSGRTARPARDSRWAAGPRGESARRGSSAGSACSRPRSRSVTRSCTSPWQPISWPSPAMALTLVRIVLGDPRGNEEARADLGSAQHAQDAGESLEDAEAPLRERHRLLDAAGEPERLGIEVERERAGGPGLPGPGGIGVGGRDIRP